MKWKTKRQEAFEKIKEAITKDCHTVYYDPSKLTILTVDASPVGLGAVLTQLQPYGTERAVNYAGRSLTAVERYSQTEREALAVIWGCECHHMHLIGKEFELRTDHKPLETIYNTASNHHHP